MNDDELKEYSPTIMGFASSLLDKLGINFIPAGRDTWHSTAPKEDTLIDLGGKPSNDTRTSAERNADYLNSPYLRWKSSMLNGTNPLVGLDRTFGTALVGASTVYGIKSIPTIAKAFVRNPRNTLTTTLVGGLAGTGIGAATSVTDKAIHGEPTFFSTLGNLYGFNVARQIVDPVLRATHFYRAFSPFGYDKDISGDPLMKRGWKTIRSILRGYPRNTDLTPDYVSSNIEGFYRRHDPATQNITPEGRVIFRDAAYRKYLGLPERPEHNLYLSNGDNTYRYNMDYVNKVRTRNNGTEFDPKDFERLRTPGGYGDVVTSNGGIVNYNRQILPDGTIKYSMQDTWDLHPFKNLKRVSTQLRPYVEKAPEWFRDIEVSGLMGNGKPFILKQDFYEKNN